MHKPHDEDMKHHSQETEAADPFETGDEAVEGMLTSRSATSNLTTRSGLNSLSATKKAPYTPGPLRSRALTKFEALSEGTVGERISLLS